MKWRDIESIPDKGCFLVYVPEFLNMYLVEKEKDSRKLRIYGSTWYLYGEPKFWMNLPEAPNYEEDLC
jgi:hypothetical protein